MEKERFKIKCDSRSIYDFCLVHFCHNPYSKNKIFKSVLNSPTILALRLKPEYKNKRIKK